MAVIRCQSGNGGGSGKVVTSAIHYSTMDVVQTFTVNELSQIDEVVVYHASPQYNTSAFKVNGTDYITPCTTNSSRNTITEISGNTFKMKWQSENDFTYVAIQNS